MKTSALVMGIVGGVFGMLLALFAMAVGNLGNDTTLAPSGQPPSCSRSLGSSAAH